MTETLQKKCLTAYYKTDIEPTLDRLHQVKDIVSNFELEGANRLMSALKMKHMDLDEIDRLAEYISQAREKMDKELVRLHKYLHDPLHYQRVGSPFLAIISILLSDLFNLRIELLAKNARHRCQRAVQPLPVIIL